VFWLDRKDIIYYFDLITVLTKKEIKVRYKIIFYFVFKIVMKFNIKEYSLFLISGLFPWQWISNSITGGAGSFIGNTSLIKKVVFPRYFLPLAQVLNDAFHFIVSIPMNIFFRDFQYIIGLIMTLLFYLTPVFYDMSFVPKKYKNLVLINPFTPLITNWRELFMHNHIDFTNYSLSLFYSLIVLVLGFVVYKKLQVRFAEVI